jgi:hypothetical protein
MPAFAARALMVLGGLALLAGCSTQATFQKVPKTGRLEGEPHLEWIAPNTFLFYQPEGEKPFSFTTHKADTDVHPSAPGRGRYRFANLKIVPGMMITNGASVPRSFWHIPGLSPWDYAQAAVIHDWLFEAHHRYLAGEKGYEKYAKITLDDAADIFAECIHKNMMLAGGRTRFIQGQQKLHPGDPAWREVQKVFPDNKESAFELWAYHYAVSSDSISPAARKIWDSRTSDLGVCRTILATKLGSEAFRAKIRHLVGTSERVTRKLDEAKVRAAAMPAARPAPQQPESQSRRPKTPNPSARGH